MTLPTCPAKRPFATEGGLVHAELTNLTDRNCVNLSSVMRRRLSERLRSLGSRTALCRCEKCQSVAHGIADLSEFDCWHCLCNSVLLRTHMASGTRLGGSSAGLAAISGNMPVHDRLEKSVAAYAE